MKNQEQQPVPRKATEQMSHFSPKMAITGKIDICTSASQPNETPLVASETLQILLIKDCYVQLPAGFQPQPRHGHCQHQPSHPSAGVPKRAGPVPCHGFRLAANSSAAPWRGHSSRAEVRSHPLHPCVCRGDQGAGIALCLPWETLTHLRKLSLSSQLNFTY